MPQKMPLGISVVIIWFVKFYNIVFSFSLFSVLVLSWNLYLVRLPDISFRKPVAVDTLVLKCVSFPKLNMLTL